MMAAALASHAPCAGRWPAPRSTHLPSLLVCLTADAHWVGLEDLAAGQGRRTCSARLKGVLRSEGGGGSAARGSRGRRRARTLPLHASLNLVPLPQPRGQGNPILRFLQGERSWQERGLQRRPGGRIGTAASPHAARRWPACSPPPGPHLSHFCDFRNFSKQCVWSALSNAGERGGVGGGLAAAGERRQTGESGTPTVQRSLVHPSHAPPARCPCGPARRQPRENSHSRSLRGRRQKKSSPKLPRRPPQSPPHRHRGRRARPPWR